MQQTHQLDAQVDAWGKQKAVNVASVPQRSPFRYPGGKTWFVPRLREWLHNQPVRPDLLVEPFAGGGIVSLTAIFEEITQRALMVELDDEIAAVWKVVAQGESEWLAKEILEFKMSKRNVIAELKKNPSDYRGMAFRTIIKNRTLHGGILAAGSGLIKNGESGKGLLSRWYPLTLAKRFREIDRIHAQLEFRHADAFTILSEYKDDPNSVFFIDPPYTAGGKKAGKRLYNHYALDHDLLFQKCTDLKGDFIMTYDNAPEVINLAKKYNLQAKPIAMKNTHHAKMTELVIGRNLDWMAGIERVLEKQARYASKGRKAKLNDKKQRSDYVRCASSA